MKKLLFALPLLWILVSCAKKVQPIPRAPSCLIISINDSSGSAKETPVYDSNGNLVEINYMAFNEPSKYFEYNNNRMVRYSCDKDLIYYKYNTANRLDTILHYKEDVLMQRTAFKYDLDGNIVNKTSYRDIQGVFMLSDSCIYTGYTNGRPLQMKQIYTPWSVDIDPLYTYEYDARMNRTKTYLKTQGSDNVLIEENTFASNHDASDLLKYVYLSSLNLESITHISSYVRYGDQELFMAGAVMNRSLPIETKNYDGSGAQIYSTKVVDMNTIHGAFPKSWKLYSNDSQLSYAYFNISYSCE